MAHECRARSVEDSAGSEPAAATPLSDALEGRREWNWRGIVLEAGGGIDKLARSTCGATVPSGSRERPFLLLVESDGEPLSSAWLLLRECTLSRLVVRDRGSMNEALNAAEERSYIFVAAGRSRKKCSMTSRPCTHRPKHRAILGNRQ